MAYTNTGPFTNGTSPGISAAFLNAIEAFLDSINTAAYDTHISSSVGIVTLLGLIVNGAIQTNPTAVTVTGTTSGTAVLYQFLIGTVKAAILFDNGYRNSTTTEQTISLPTPFTSKCLVFTGNIQTLTPYSSGTAQTNTVRVLSTIAAAGGSSTLQNNISAYSIGYFTSNFDAIGLGKSQGGTFTDITLLIGL